MKATAAAAAVIVIAISLCCPMLDAAEMVTSENSSLQALHLIFPNAKVTRVAAQAHDGPSAIKDPVGRVVASVTNALENEPEYEVVAPVAADEKDAASDIERLPEEWWSDRRRLRMRLYRWNAAADPDAALLLAVLNYDFIDAHPARCCRAVGKLVLLSSGLDRILDSFNRAPRAFTMFTEIRFLNLDGKGEKLMISANGYGVGSIMVESAVFEARNNNKLQPVLGVDTVVLFEADLETADVHTLILDERRTRLAGGKRYVFTEKSFVENGSVRRRAVSRTISYPVGTGVPLRW